MGDRRPRHDGRRRRRRRGRRLLILGGMAAATWAWRNHQLGVNERKFDHPAPGDRR